MSAEGPDMRDFSLLRRRSACSLSEDCNLSFQSSSLATDQQLVAACGIWWANETQQLMFFHDAIPA